MLSIGSSIFQSIPTTRRITVADVDQELEMIELLKPKLSHETELWSTYRYLEPRFEPAAREKFEAHLEKRAKACLERPLSLKERWEAKRGADVFEQRREVQAERLGPLQHLEAPLSVELPHTSQGIPPFDARGLLPPGIHDANWSELSERFGTNAHRRQLLDGLLAAARNVRDAGGEELFLGGSFTTDKAEPNDFDGMVQFVGLDEQRLHDAFRSGWKEGQMKAFGGELWSVERRATGRNSGYEPFGTFYQHTTDGEPRGLVRLDLSTLPPP